MTAEFNIPKTDNTTMCEVADLELIDNFQTKTDAYLKMVYLKRIASDAFDLNDSTLNRNFQDTIPAQTVVYNPYYIARQWWDSISNIAANPTSLTNAPLEIAYDYYPIYSTGWPSPDSNIDYGAKAVSGNFGSWTGGNDCTLSMRTTWKSNNDDPLYDITRCAMRANMGKYIINFGNVYYAQNAGDSSSLSGSTPSSFSLSDMGGGNISPNIGNPVYSINSIAIGTCATRYMYSRASKNISTSTGTLATYSTRMDWWCFTRTGVSPAGGYPSLQRTLTTANVIMKITGTNMKYLNTYIEANTTGGSFSLQYSTDNITYSAMTQVYNSGNDYFHSNSIPGTTNQFYIKLTLNGTAGSSCSVSKFMGEGQ
jgi:hypothetical protein